MASDADAYERGVKISQTSLTPNFREGVQANPWFQLGYQMGMKHGAGAAGMMSRAKSEFPAVAARLQASRPGAKAKFKVEDRFYFGKGRKERFFASGYDNAKDRVRRSSELGKYAKIIMQPEFDSADHWDWVSTASIGEIVNWAKSIARNI